VDAALSVVVPVLDEAPRLPQLIAALQAQEDIRLVVVLADGGSRDGSRELGRRCGARVVAAPAGRGAQMNAAARLCDTPYLLFLHADSRLTRRDQLARAVAALERERSHDGRVAGHFPLRFERGRAGQRWLYRYMEAKTALNRASTFNGDQGLLIATDFFRALGGFDERLPFLEDQRLGARIRERGRWITLPDPLITSARRFETEGPYRRYLLMALIMGCEATGLEEFFAYAPDAYRRQARARRLRIAPFIQTIGHCLHRRPRAERRRLWRAAGAYAGANAWQPFFLLDVLSGRAPGRTPCLDAFDRHLSARLSRPRLEAALGLLTRFWVLGVLRAYFRWSEPAA